MFWFYLQFLSEIFFILRRIQRDIIKNVSRSSCKVLVIVVRFLWKLSFLDSFSRYKKISNFIKIRLVGTKLFHADGRTDMTNLIDAFCNFANEPDYKMVLANFYFFCWSKAHHHILTLNYNILKLELYIVPVFSWKYELTHWKLSIIFGTWFHMPKRILSTESFPIPYGSKIFFSSGYIFTHDTANSLWNSTLVNFLCVSCIFSLKH